MDDTTGFLSAAAILGANDLASEAVEVPEWGGKVMVRGMTGAERDAYESAMLSVSGTNVGLDKAGMLGARARICATCIIDPVSGKRLFTDAQVKDLGQKSGAALDRVFGVAQRLSGISKQDLEELRKNSNGAQSADSGSDSP